MLIIYPYFDFVQIAGWDKTKALLNSYTHIINIVGWFLYILLDFNIVCELLGVTKPDITKMKLQQTPNSVQLCSKTRYVHCCYKSGNILQYDVTPKTRTYENYQFNYKIVGRKFLNFLKLIHKCVWNNFKKN